MGRYELVEGKLVNDRAVWKRVGKEAYLFHGATGSWFVYDKAAMEAGKASGWVCSAVAADALVPTEAAAGEWQTGDGKGWSKAPKLQVRAV